MYLNFCPEWFKSKLSIQLYPFNCFPLYFQRCLRSNSNNGPAGALWNSAYKEPIEEMEPGSFQQCASGGWEAVDIRWNHGGSDWTEEMFPNEDNQAVEPSCPERLCSLCPWRFWNPHWVQPEATWSELRSWLCCEHGVGLEASWGPF